MIEQGSVTISAAEISSEERVFAAISHGSAVLMGWGIFVPLVIWITQRKKSKFAAFHAIQALAFQLTQFLFMMVVMFVLMFLMFAFMFGAIMISDVISGGPPAAIFLIQFVFMGGMFCTMGIYPVVGIFAGLLTIAGKNFRYPLLGAWIENYLMEEKGEALE